MPVFTLQCPQCRHEFKGLVLAGSKVPECWVCSACGSDRAAVKPGTTAEPHPWDAVPAEEASGRSLRHPASCPCCF